MVSGMDYKCTFLLLLMSIGTASSAAACPSGAYVGRVFRDYSFDGARDGIEEPGVAGVTVTISDASGATIGRTATDALGVYMLTAPPGTPVRIEVGGLPSYLQPGPFGVDAGTTVTFPAACENNVAVVNPAEFCDESTELVTSCFAAGDQQTGPFAGGPAVVSFPESGGAAGVVAREYGQPGYQVRATIAQVGSVFGLAYRSASETVYAGSFIRRHAGIGRSGNPTTIYSLPADGSGVKDWLTLDVARVDPHTGDTDGQGPQWPADFGTFAAVFKEGLGDLEISHDGKVLYGIDLGARNLFAVTILPNGAPAPGPYNSYDLVAMVAATPFGIACTGPGGQFASGDIRPFGLSYHDGELYVGIVCSGQSRSRETTALPVRGLSQASDTVTRPGDRSTLRGAVFRLGGSRDLQEVVSFPLNYPRACQTEEENNCINRTGAQWNPWVDVYPFHDSPITSGHSQAVWAQPVIADIEFDRSGMIIGLADRWGFQTGPITQTPEYPQNVRPNKKGQLANTFNSGDIIRVCRVGQEWVVEELISGDARCGTEGRNVAGRSGLALDEYYFEDDYAARDKRHGETVIGGLVQLPGRPDVLATTFDPLRPIDFQFFDGGVTWYRRETGAWSKAFRLFDGTNDPNEATFGKAAGLGDLESICVPAPIQVGNRVWLDNDRDGSQDAGEPPIPGVVVRLIDLTAGAIQVGETVTTDLGEYYFGGRNNRNVSTPLLPERTYEVRILLADPALGGRTLTISNSSEDSVDSDGIVSGIHATAGLTTGLAGHNNHTYDFGFHAPIIATPTPTPTATAGPPVILPPKSIPPGPPGGPPPPTPEKIHGLLISVDSGGDFLTRLAQKAVGVRARGAQTGRACSPLAETTVLMTKETLYQDFARNIWGEAWAFSIYIPEMEMFCRTEDTNERLTAMRQSVARIAGTGLRNLRSCRRTFSPATRLRKRIQASRDRTLAAIAKLQRVFPSC